MMGHAALLLLALAAGARAQFDPTAPLEKETLILARVRVTADREFRRLPNCTCTMNVERSRRLARRGRFELLDQLRLEVALVEGKELYSWPGAQRFDDRELVDMVSGGAIGSGEFATHARAVLLGGVVKLRYQGEEELNGRPAHRFDYEVPMVQSRFFMRIGTVSTTVGYRGSVFAELESYQLRRLTLEIHEVPPQLPLEGGSIRIDYELRALGESRYLLPAQSESTFATQGQENRNLTSYSNCRQFAGESTLVFEEPEETEEETPAAKIQWGLPKELQVALKAVQEVGGNGLAVGDEVEFEVVRDAVQRREVWLRKGARVKMRVALARCVDSPVTLCMVALKPESFADDNREGRLRAVLEEPSLAAMMGLAAPMRGAQALTMRVEALEIPEGASLLVLRVPRLSPTFRMVWRTLESSGDDIP